MEIYKLKHGIIIEYAENNALIIDSINNKFFYVNNIESEILKAIEGNYINQVIDKYKKIFPKEDIEKDVSDFFLLLKKHNLIEIRS